ncbi:MAG: methyl-accepting chemotaxis protein [Caulobacter sp.]
MIDVVGADGTERLRLRSASARAPRERERRGGGQYVHLQAIDPSTTRLSHKRDCAMGCSAWPGHVAETLMALVKKTALANRPLRSSSTEPLTAAPAPTLGRRSPIRTSSAKERIGAATLELAGGLTQAAGAAAELTQAMNLIASGAEEAAGAAQESLAAVGQMAGAYEQARARAELARQRSRVLEDLAAEARAAVTASVDAVIHNARRQSQSVTMVRNLEVHAQRVGGLIGSVADIADQTNLLALNAAIEADRAGDAGLAFSVLAEEIRALADASQGRSRDVEAVSRAIVAGVNEIASRLDAAATTSAREVEGGKEVAHVMASLALELVAMRDDSEQVLAAAIEAAAAIEQARRGAEVTAAAAEEQAAAAAQAQSAIAQQTQSLEQSEQAASELARMTDQIAAGSLAPESIGAISVAAEQLSSTVQELSGSASQILVAADQINRGAQSQASATQESSAAMDQIRRSTETSAQSASASRRRAAAMREVVHKSRADVERMIAAVRMAREETDAVVLLVDTLEDQSRRISKSSDAITLLALRTTMLATSGAVEAARAGEAGRGFKLVAADVRKLADAAGRNADEVKDLVDDVALESARVRRDLETVARAAEAEVARNGAVLERFAVMAQDIDTRLEGAEEISRGADAILQAVEQVSVGVGQIAAAADQAGGAALQAAGAARQQAQGAEDLAAAIEEIALLAEALAAPTS